MIGRHVLTPLCYGETYGLATGNVFHGVMGAAGHSAAREVLADFKRGRIA